MAVVGLVEQGGTPAGHLQVVSPQFQSLGLLKKDYRRDGKYSKLQCTRDWLPGSWFPGRGGAVMLRCPKVFHFHQFPPHSLMSFYFGFALWPTGFNQSPPCEHECGAVLWNLRNSQVAVSPEDIHFLSQSAQVPLVCLGELGPTRHLHL